VAEPEHDNDQPPRRDNTKWRRAADVLAAVRDKQRHRGKGMSGRIRLSDGELVPIQLALQDTHNVQAAAKYLDDTGTMARQLFDYLGEMSRRNSVTIPKDIGKEVHFILAVELLANMEDLDVPPGELISVTVQNGVLGFNKKPALCDAFSDTPSVFKRAAVSYPSDPEGFLTGVIAKIGALEADDRFASLRDTPSVFKHAAVHHPSDPEGFLTGVIGKIGELAADDRFASLRDSPGVFKHAAVGNPSDPEAFLIGVVAKIGELAADKRFASLRDTPYVFKLAGVGYAADPEGFLTGVISKISELESDKRFASLRDSPHVFKEAAVHYPSDPERFLTEVMAEQARKRINGKKEGPHATRER
jgi:hypothetical protein